MAVVSSYLGANVPVRCSRVVPVHGPLQGACDGVPSRRRPGPGWWSADRTAVTHTPSLRSQERVSRLCHLHPAGDVSSQAGGLGVEPVGDVAAGPVRRRGRSEPSRPPPSERRNTAPWWSHSLLRAVGFR